MSDKLKIMTSYFSSKAPADRKVCIARHNRFFKGKRAKLLAPSNPKAENWAEAYHRDLEMRFPQGFGLLELLEEISRETPEPILCCYEKDPGQCHRRVLADYCREFLKLDIPEWEEKEKQSELF